MNNTLFITSWKMNACVSDTQKWLTQHAKELDNIIKETGNTIVISPSFTSLYTACHILKDTHISLGAQHCSPFESGSYTGDVSVKDLKELNCSYCIIGHFERRTIYHESPEYTPLQCSLLVSYHITPIICIGEIYDHKDDYLHKIDLCIQITSALRYITDKKQKIYIAYEPASAIGAKAPSQDILNDITKYLDEYIQTHFGSYNIDILYGGGVNEHSIKDIKEIPYIKGYLVGSSSLDFQTLKKIVLS
jgi:triosephosphate isomerase